MPSDMNAIEFKNVWKKYSRDLICHRSLREDVMNFFQGGLLQKADLDKNEFWALKNVSFHVGPGEAVGLYGPNGAGKSSILKLIANITYPNQGEIVVNGRHVAPLLEIGAGFHPDLTGRENIFVYGAILGMSIPEIKRKVQDIIAFAELPEFIDMPVKKYSMGMYVRLGFSIAIHSDADIFLIDEIIAVGDKNFQEKCIQRILQLKNDPSKSLLIVLHDLVLLKQTTDRIIYCQKGEIS